jgi:hypothetical protein
MLNSKLYISMLEEIEAQRTANDTRLARQLRTMGSRELRVSGETQLLQARTQVLSCGTRVTVLPTIVWPDLLTVRTPEARYAFF